MGKKRALQTIAIISICVLVDILLHLLTSAYGTTPGDANDSGLSVFIGTGAAATLWALLAFSCAGYVFHRIHGGIPGRERFKGLRYGTAVSMLWLFAMLEGASLFGNSLINEFVVGLSDAVPAFLLGVLLNLTAVKKNNNLKPLPLRRKIRTVCSFSGIFLIGRYAAYFLGFIQSGYEARPTHTFFWTLIMGACIGVVCVLLDNAEAALSMKRKAARFGGIIFGVNWAAFLLFMPLVFSGFILDVLLRIILDVSLAAIAYYLAFSPLMESLFQKRKIALNS